MYFTDRPIRILFVLKRRDDYNAEVHSSIGLSTGLYNSAAFMNSMLNSFETYGDDGYGKNVKKKKFESKLVVVVDNNSIDREVTLFRPDYCIIEALWVVPEKFNVLSKLHPTVKWIIRLHSELPFIAGEGMAMDWIGEYSKFPSITIAANSPRTLEEVRYFLKRIRDWDDDTTERKVVYLPNYYPIHLGIKKTLDKHKDTLDVACFGAIRPLKNQLVQAVAAVRAADELGKKLNFHINAGRLEMYGQPVMRNLSCFFQHYYDVGHRMVIHDWTPHDEFLKLCYTMDLGLQVSLSETFNIVTADLLCVGVPVVLSNEIPWAASLFCADPAQVSDIAAKIVLSYEWPRLNTWMNVKSLDKYVKNSKRVWCEYFHQPLLEFSDAQI